jgi:predicted RNase H-like HicB family nuclease
MTKTFTAYIEKDGDYYIGIVPEIPGCHTQAKSLDELEKNLKEVTSLCLEELTSEEKKQLPKFVGIQTFEIAA